MTGVQGKTEVCIGRIRDVLTSCSTSIRGAITAGRRMGWLGVACICSTLVVIDGPLLQRASTVVDAPFSHRVTLNTTMVSKLPIGGSPYCHSLHAIDI